MMEESMDLNSLFDMLKNPQALKAQAEEMQKKMSAVRATGSAGGGMVKITLTGAMDMVECIISPELAEFKDIGLLQDLIRAAHHDAAEKVKEAIRSEFAGSLTGAGQGFPFGNISV